MDNFLEIIWFGLATWRISSLRVHEAGPWNIFRRLRERAGIVHDEQGEPLVIPDGFFAGVLSCVWCSSIWVAAGLMLAWLLLPMFIGLFAAVMVFSAVAILMERVVRG